MQLEIFKVGPDQPEHSGNLIANQNVLTTIQHLPGNHPKTTPTSNNILSGFSREIQSLSSCHSQLCFSIIYQSLFCTLQNQKSDNIHSCHLSIQEISIRQHSLGIKREKNRKVMTAGDSNDADVCLDCRFCPMQVCFRNWRIAEIIIYHLGVLPARHLTHISSGKLHLQCTMRCYGQNTSLNNKRYT